MSILIAAWLCLNIQAYALAQTLQVTTTSYETVVVVNPNGPVVSTVGLCNPFPGGLQLCDQVTWLNFQSNTSATATGSTAVSSASASILPTSFVLGGSGNLEGFYLQYDTAGNVLLETYEEDFILPLHLDDAVLQYTQNASQFLYLRQNSPFIEEQFPTEDPAVIDEIRQVRLGDSEEITPSDVYIGWLWNDQTRELRFFRNVSTLLISSTSLDTTKVSTIISTSVSTSSGVQETIYNALGYWTLERATSDTENHGLEGSWFSFDAAQGATSPDQIDSKLVVAPATNPRSKLSLDETTTQGQLTMWTTSFSYDYVLCFNSNPIPGGTPFDWSYFEAKWCKKETIAASGYSKYIFKFDPDTNQAYLDNMGVYFLNGGLYWWYCSNTGSYYASYSSDDPSMDLSGTFPPGACIPIPSRWQLEYTPRNS
ncbi:hypothetical protein AA313_de0200498 [Arthrobotrys entomopaga]|nr:hypothetical protein AA313_de0200498 [Arthrobotrys entomopaga]